MGEDRNVADRYIDHPLHDDCVELCERFDQNCVDSDHDSLPVEFFRLIVEDVFSTAAPRRYARPRSSPTRSATQMRAASSARR
jgi:predicted HD phosphohydrolase